MLEKQKQGLFNEGIPSLKLEMRFEFEDALSINPPEPPLPRPVESENWPMIPKRCCSSSRI
jgi:hypothetical protein